MSLAKFRKVFKNAKKTATQDLSNPKKNNLKNDKNKK